MSEFVFRNLSVKLFPAADETRPFVCIACSDDYECGCSCTDTPPTVLAWTAFPADATRFRFEPS